jgi:LysM repeat protein
VALKNSITLELFEAINPSIDATCSNLTPDVYYCVFPTENWNQTITTTAYTTAPAPAPTESGASDACYTWYVVVSGDTCSKIESSYGITSDEFAVWNPAVDADCTNLQTGEA